jgi:hypothetical protein
VILPVNKGEDFIQLEKNIMHQPSQTATPRSRLKESDRADTLLLPAAT